MARRVRRDGRRRRLARRRVARRVARAPALVAVLVVRDLASRDGQPSRSYSSPFTLTLNRCRARPRAARRPSRSPRRSPRRTFTGQGFGVRISVSVRVNPVRRAAPDRVAVVVLQLGAAADRPAGVSGRVRAVPADPRVVRRDDALAPLAPREALLAVARVVDAERRAPHRLGIQPDADRDARVAGRRDPRLREPARARASACGPAAVDESPPALKSRLVSRLGLELGLALVL